VGDVPLSRAFHPRRGLAWGQLLLGWVCAQGLLTLIPIAPPGWGTPFLLVTGGGFALWALSGLRTALSTRPLLEVDYAGFTLEGRRTLWAAVERYRIDREAGEIAIAFRTREAARAALPPHRRALAALGLLPPGASLGLSPRRLDAGLTEIAAAFRDVRPDLEARP